MPNLNILFAASEAVPFAKSGGLADVAGALPKALAELGHDVRVVMPRYYIVDKERYKLKALAQPLGVPMGSMGELWAGVFEGRLPGSDVKVYFIDHEGFFGRARLYDDENGYAYVDNDNRFLFLSRAAMQLAKLLDFEPDIVHAHDWHTAAMPLLLNTVYASDPHFAHCASVLTLHNLQHQGRFYGGVMDVLDTGWEHFNHYELEDHGGVNLLKGGIVHADAVNAVSKKYAQEIRTPEFGWGLESVIRAHEGKVFGILNGVDYDEWSPAVDPFIAVNYDTDSMEGKGACKCDLQQTFDLPVRDDVAVIGLVGRLAEQKGIELLAGAIGGILRMDVQVVLLGTGEKWAEHFFSDVAARYGDKFACYIGYRNDLAHKIEAGSDLFLMPSLFEPCGLNQIYSLRYGTLPIVRATGGLDDTIENFDETTLGGNGFKFEFATADALYHTVEWAVRTWHERPEAIDALRQNAMAARFDWKQAAEAYTDIYEFARSRRKTQRLQ